MLIGYRSARFMRRALHLRVCGSGQFLTRMLNPRSGGEHIYCHPDSFIVSQRFSLARYSRCFKLKSKPYVYILATKYICWLKPC